VAERLRHQADVHHTHDGIQVGDHVIRQMPVSDLESVLALQKTDVHPDMLSKAIHAAAACKPAYRVMSSWRCREGCSLRSSPTKASAPHLRQ